MSSIERPAVAPFLAAWYLALNQITERHLTLADWQDLSGSILLATGAAWLAWVISAVVSRSRPVRTVAAVFVIAWFMLYGTLSLLFLDWLSSTPDADLMVLAGWIVLLGGGLAALGRWRVAGEGTTRGLTAGLSILVLIATVGFTRSRFPTRPAAALARSDGAARATDNTLPDIYVIVPDKLGSAGTLEKRYGVNFTPVVDSLQRLGFVVPRDARTNYIHTQLVLATFLNWEYVHEAVADSVSPWSASHRMVEDAKLWTLLKDRGYRFAFFPTGFPVTAGNVNADITLTPPVDERGSIARTWILNSPLPTVRAAWCRWISCTEPTTFPYPIEDADAVLWKLDALVGLADSAGPTVAFLHLLVPHEPFIFNADCSPREPFWPATEVTGDLTPARQAYADQSGCLGKLILGTTTRLLARSDHSPVILLQSDHGHGHIAVDPVRGVTLPLRSVLPSQVAERLDIFAAYLFPGATAAIYDRISPVNVLPAMLSAVFDTVIHRQADRSYWSTYRDPFTLQEIVRTADAERQAADTASGSATTATAPSGNR